MGRDEDIPYELHLSRSFGSFLEVWAGMSLMALVERVSEFQYIELPLVNADPSVSVPLSLSYTARSFEVTT